jgi:hypothetical protein
LAPQAAVLGRPGSIFPFWLISEETGTFVAAFDP